MQTIRLEDIKGMKATVMGLGLNGGGLATARFLAQRGARVTVTDMKDEEALAASIAELSDYPIRYVLGRHDMDDFSGADLVVKNPAVRPDSPYLRAARLIETDLSIFLRFSTAPLVAVTGSKGKSTTASAIAYVINACGRQAFLGGNITKSPLGFLDDVRPDDVVVLELSSWQLGDLSGMGVLRPKVAVLTRIVPDHLDRYGTMEAYVADKRLIYADQSPSDYTICDADDPYGRSFASETRASVLWYGSSVPGGAYGASIPDAAGPAFARLPALGPVELVPAAIAVPGAHNRRNLAAAGLAALALGLDAGAVRESLASFPGVEHRLELCLERKGARWYNDSAATVPEAVAAAVAAFDTPIVLITGGTDKELDFDPARAAYRKAARIVLLRGSGTDKIVSMLKADDIPYEGPFPDIVAAVAKADALAEPGSVVILSPGCTSFGMFKNEFDRGRQFKAAAAAL